MSGYGRKPLVYTFEAAKTLRVMTGSIGTQPNLTRSAARETPSR